MAVSGRTSKVSSAVAVFCIVIYIAAIAFGAMQIFIDIGERRDRAEREFQDLMDRAASSAVFLGFMSDAYQETIRDYMTGSSTLLGIIISGSNTEYAFERYPGSGISWVGNYPRLKSGTGLAYPSSIPPYLNIEGQRNVTISAVYSSVDSNHLIWVLRTTLMAVLFALAISFITLFVGMLQKNKSAQDSQKSGPAPAQIYRKETEPENTLAEAAAAETPAAPEESPDDSYQEISIEELIGEISPAEQDVLLDNSNEKASDDPIIEYSIPVINEEEAPEQSSNAAESQGPQGLYTPRSNVGWESYTLDRLASEIHRCASFEQDLTFLVMEFSSGDAIDDSLYSQFAGEAISFFAMRDLIFEKGNNGLSVILPNEDLEQSMHRADEFKNRIISKLPESFEGRKGLCTGLSSRSGRLVEAGRLMMEASSALGKAKADPVSSIIAFKSDPEKYREFIKGSLNS